MAKVKTIKYQKSLTLCIGGKNFLKEGFEVDLELSETDVVEHVYSEIQKRSEEWLQKLFDEKLEVEEALAKE